MVAVHQNSWHQEIYPGGMTICNFRLFFLLISIWDDFFTSLTWSASFIFLLAKLFTTWRRVKIGWLDIAGKSGNGDINNTYCRGKRQSCGKRKKSSGGPAATKVSNNYRLLFAESHFQSVRMNKRNTSMQKRLHCWSVWLTKVDVEPVGKTEYIFIIIVIDFTEQ